MKKQLIFACATFVVAAIALSAQKNIGAPAYFPASAINSGGTLSTTCLKFPLGTQACESSDGVLRLLDAAGTAFTRLQFGGTTSSFPALTRSGVTLIAQRADGASNTAFNAGSLAATDTQITNAGGTGITINSGSGTIARSVYKVTIDRTAFIAAAVTQDLTIGTLPAKTVLLSVYGELTTVFACSVTCTSSTLSMILGTAAGGNTLLVSFDADAATAVFGDADAELGTDITRATAVQGGKVYSFSATQIVNLRLTSGTGNLGTGAATNLSTGSITFYLVTERLP
jgi:hypothetical protein